VDLTEELSAMQTRKLTSLAGAVAIATAALAGSTEAQVAAQMAPYPYEERPFGIPNVSEFDPNPPAGRGEVRIVQSPLDGAAGLPGEDGVVADLGPVDPPAFGVPNVSEFDPNPPAHLEELRVAEPVPQREPSRPRRMHYSSPAQEPAY